MGGVLPVTYAEEAAERYARGELTLRGLERVVEYLLFTSSLDRQVPVVGRNGCAAYWFNWDTWNYE